MALPILYFFLGLALRGCCQAALNRVCKPQVEGSIPPASSNLASLTTMLVITGGKVVLVGQRKKGLGGDTKSFTLENRGPHPCLIPLSELWPPASMGPDGTKSGA